MNFALGCNHDEDDTQTGNELCGGRTPDGDTRPHPAAMAEMQQLLNRLIAKHTRSPAYWRLAIAQGREGQPAYGDIIQAAIGDRAAPRTAAGCRKTLRTSY